MEIRQNKNGAITFKEKVYISNGRTRTKTFKRRSDAIAWKRQARSERDRNRALGIEPLKENILFTECLHLWLKTRIIPNLSAKTIADYQSISNKHLLPFMGGAKVRSIERSHGEQLIKQLKQNNLSNKTANKIITVFKQIILFAESSGYLHRNPLKGLPLLKLSEGRTEHLSRQEALQLLRSNSHHEVYPMLVIALNTGMRLGEITGLCWDRLNFESKTIEVSRTLSRNGLKETTKTNLIRHIPMNAEVQSIFKSLMRQQLSTRYVFTDSSGEPFNPDHYCERHFRKALQRAGLRKIKFHDLRHTYASQFMMNGGNIYDLQKILGHTKAEMTMRYAHLSPQHLRKVIDTVRISAEGDNSISPASAPQQKLVPVKQADLSISI